jgi:hypothetical protein
MVPLALGLPGADAAVPPALIDTADAGPDAGNDGGTASSDGGIDAALPPLDSDGPGCAVAWRGSDGEVESFAAGAVVAALLCLRRRRATD